MSRFCRVSVVIPTYNRCASVERALVALSRQSLAADEYEVIVSIDGSQDVTSAMVSQFPAPYRLRSISQPNRGRAAACNAGIRIAEGQMLVLLDDDMEPINGFLVAHLQAHSKGSRYGVVGAAPVRFTKDSPAVVQYVGRKFNSHIEILAQPRYQFKLRDFYSGNFSIDRELLLIEVGAFDESFRIYGNEDLELSVRLSKAGVQLVFSAEAVAYQHYTKDFAALARDNIAKGQTAVLLATKHPETYRNLKLSMYTQASPKWRFLRAGLLQLSAWAPVPEWIILFMTWLARCRVPLFNYFCFAVLDYFYWLGARSALRETHEAGQELPNICEAPGKLRS